jgi:hypothetical protein
MMKQLFRWIYPLAAVMGMFCASGVAGAQNPATIIRVLDASGLEGVAGVVLLINPGDTRKSAVFVTNGRGEAITNGLQCAICTVSAFDPRGLFSSRTTEFSSSSLSFSFVMQLRPLIDTVSDPKAVSVELVIRNSKGEAVVQQDVVVRPTLVTLEKNQLSIQKTDAAGRVTVPLRSGEYVVGMLSGGVASEARLAVATAKEGCVGGAVTCVIASPQSTRHLKAVDIQLSSVGLR